MRELIKIVRYQTPRGWYYLRLFDTGRRDWRGQTVLAYTFRHKGKTIFSGKNFSGSPMHADDSKETARSLLNFLTLRYGDDTDREYFANYTAEQIEWAASSDCEYLASLVY